MIKVLDANIFFLEKKLIFLCQVNSFSQLKSDQNLNLNTIEVNRNKKSNIIMRLPVSYFFEKNNRGIRMLNLQNLKNFQDFNFFSFGQNENHRVIGNTKPINLFLNSSIDENSTGKRRKRRKFTTDEERRIARILKNRRTAEESRQRRIQKMKDLENFAASFDEKEKKLREEIQYLGKQNANQAAELCMLKEKLTKHSLN
jgi:hypothetical protein